MSRHHRNPLTRWTRVAACALTLGGATLAAAAVPASAAAALTPTVDCAVNNGDGTDTAYFGYLNTGSSVNYPIGDDNTFVPGPEDQGQPTTFDAGSYPEVTGVTFLPTITPSLTWVLNGATAVASTSTPACRSSATGAASAVSTSGATLNGLIDPRGSATSYHFDYGTTTDYGQSSAAQSSSSDDPSLVSAALTSLTPGTTYHYRIVSSNAVDGTTDGADQTFTTASPAPPAGADLAVSVISAPSQTGRRRPFTYVFAVTNNGPATATTATFTDVVPGGVSVTSAGVTAGSGTCQLGATVNCALGALSPGQHAEITLTALPYRAGQVVDVAFARPAGADPDLSNNLATVTTSVGPAWARRQR